MRHVSFTGALVVSLIAGTAFAGDYPIRVNDRPITMNAGMTQVDLQANNLKDAGDALSFGLAGRHSLSDQLQIDVLTDVMIKPEAQWSEELGVGASYTVHKTDTLDVSPGIFVPLNLGGGDVINAVLVHGAVQYAVSDALAVTVGQGLISYFKLGDSSMSSANVNALFGLQLADNMNLGVMTHLARIALSGESNETTTVADGLPAGLQFTFSTDSTMDIGLNVELGDVMDFDSELVGVNLLVAKRL